jgi:hypothetical protein
MNRSEFSMIVLAELVLEQGCLHACERHLPILFHTAIIYVDHSNPWIYKHAKVLLVNLIAKLTGGVVRCFRSSSIPGCDCHYHHQCTPCLADS